MDLIGKTLCYYALSIFKESFFMKKRILAAVFAAAVASSGVFATGIGPQLNFDPVVTPGYVYSPNTWGLACSAKFDSMPIYWALSTGWASYSYKTTVTRNGVTYDTYTDTPLFSVSATGDYWMMNPTISGIWKWYWGLGGAVTTSFGTSSGDFYLAAGPRGVIGMNWHFCDGFMELYAQGAVEPEIQTVFGDDGKQNGYVRFPIYFPFNAGLRFWF